MRSPRLFTQQALQPGTEILLEEAASHHLSQVLRLRAGALRLFNGDGCDYQCQLLQIEKRACRVRVEQIQTKEPAAPLDIHLCLGVSKGERMDFALQKATELGVQQIYPLITEHGNVRLSQERWEKKLRHWQGILIHACEQSGRCRVPQLHPTQTFTDWLALRPDQTSRLLLDPSANLTLHQAPAPAPGSSLALLIGPEGGLSETELTQARQHDFQGVRLGPRILRTETAPLAALAAIQALWGDFRC